MANKLNTPGVAASKEGNIIIACLISMFILSHVPGNKLFCVSVSLRILPTVRVSPALCWVLEQDTYPLLVLVQSRKIRPDMTEKC